MSIKIPSQSEIVRLLGILLINPEYRAQDLDRAIALASAIYQEKSIAEVRADLPVSVFTFADEESWDRCQAMIERVISRNRKPPAGRNEDPPVR